MSGLSPELQQLVPTYKEAHSPTNADLERIMAGLKARLGDAAFAAVESAQITAATTASTATTGLLVMKGAGIGLAGLAALGSLWYIGTQRPPPVDASQTQPEPVVALQPQNAPAVNAPAVNAPELPKAEAPLTAATPAVNNDAARAAAPSRPRDKLAEEVALMTRAQAALHGGKPAAALEALSEHERKFGNGLLAEERTAARVQALCALGRTAEASAQSSQLSPKSLHGQANACGARK
jgi:hypothetical protein